jgi:hypothetical protein
MNYLLIDADGLVVNVIVINDGTPFSPPSGHTVEPVSQGVWIGWQRVNGVWVAPEPGADDA